MCPYILRPAGQPPVAISTFDDLDRIHGSVALSTPIEYLTWDALSTRIGLGAWPNGFSHAQMLAMFNARAKTRFRHSSRTDMNAPEQQISMSDVAHRLRKSLDTYRFSSGHRRTDALDAIEIVLDQVPAARLLASAELRNELGVSRYSLLCNLIHDRLNERKVTHGRLAEPEVTAQPRYLVIPPHDGWAVIDRMAADPDEALRCSGPERLMRLTASEFEAHVPPVREWVDGIVK